MCMLINISMLPPTQNHSRRLQLLFLFLFGLSIPLGTLAVQSIRDTRSKAAELPQLPRKVIKPALLSGYVFVDTNMNGERDLEEMGYSGATIRVNAHNQTIQPSISMGVSGSPIPIMVSEPIFFTDTYGYFKTNISASGNDVDLSIDVPAGYKSSTDPSIRAKDSIANAHPIVEFGIYPIGSNTITPQPTPTAPYPVEVRTFTPTDDGYVNKATPDRIYGMSSSLSVNGGNNPVREAYIKFSVTGVTRLVQKAILRVYVTNNSSTNGPALYTASTSWVESTLSYATKPQLTSTLIEDKGMTPGNTWLEYEVTPVISKSINGTYTFALIPTSSDGITISSKEGIHKPELVVTF